LIDCLKNNSCVTPPRISDSRFRKRVLDLNQIKRPGAQSIVQVAQALLRAVTARRYERGDRHAGDGGEELAVF
jgi:hypothetical protein